MTQIENGTACVKWNGSYGNDYVGGITYRMDDSGGLEVDYDFTYRGAEMIAREIGLSFEVPLSFGHFEWDRRAE